MSTPRLLLATTGWPSGILELASWVRHQRLAEVVVFQIQPGLAFPLDAEEHDYLAAGPVADELAEAFRQRGWPLPPQASLVSEGRDAWRIAAAQGTAYRIDRAEAGWEVTVPENLDSPEFRRALDDRIARQARRDRFLSADGSYRPAVREALRCLGAAMLARLIRFDPHAVGFRIEGGQFEDVCRFIRAVRLFSPAEILLGGPTATSHPVEVFEQCGPDYVFAGEAEETLAQFLRLARKPNSKDRQPEIPGLVYRYGGRTCVNTLPRDGYGRSVVEAADLPGSGGACPALVNSGKRRAVSRDSRSCLRNRLRPQASAEVLVANRLDWSLLENFRRPFESLFFTGGRGCPGACSFCAKLHGQEVRVKTARQLLEEIEAADARVTEGALRVGRWPLFEHVDDLRLAGREVAWAAVYDEDLLLNRRRAIEFFALWEESPLKGRYRLSLQTNPCTLLGPDGRPHGELFAWIDRLKPMVQLGAESFHPEMLRRWHKRHTLEQLETVLDAMDRTRQDYTVFQLLTDFESTPEELLESLRRLVVAGFRRRRMRIASSPYTIPLYDSDTRALLEFSGRLGPQRVRHFTDYERPQPGWMDPLVAELADLADAQLRWTLNLPHRESALASVFEVILQRLSEEPPAGRMGPLLDQARAANDEIREMRFQAVR